MIYRNITAAVCVLCAAAILGGCSAFEHETINPAAVYDLPQEGTTVDGGVELIPEEAEQTAESAAEQLTELFEEGTVPDEALPEPPEAPSDAEAQTAEAEVFTDEDENIDSFYIDNYAAYDLTPSQRDFTKQSIFVGDSICRGFGEYNITADKRVYARGNLAAWSFFDYVFYYGEKDEEISYTEVLKRTQPKFVFLSMGMNDINMSTEEQFCENYRLIIEHTLANSDADIYICAITPVDSEFTTNYRVDCYNLAVAAYIEQNFGERVHFVDFGKHLRDEEGKLAGFHSSGDGIHLGPYAYYIALWEMHRTLVSDGLYGEG